jgi:hypothetical protein
MLGIPANDWLSLLRENEYAIPPLFWYRVAVVSAWSLITSYFRRREDRLYAARIREVEVTQPPLFILGHWRSGTSHLQHLLALDTAQFASPTMYEVWNPYTFLSTEQRATRWSAGLMPKTRWIDNIPFAWRMPGEVEAALAVMCRRSPDLQHFFPARAGYYERYITLRGVPAEELRQWKVAFFWFAQKLTLKYGRALLLKAPPHTARIRLLLEMFPHARFVHIRRNPYAVFQSTRHHHTVLMRNFSLQYPDSAALDARILRQYRLITEVFFEERGLIPDGQLHELAFEDLERQPIAELQAIYDRLGLPGFDAMRAKFENFLFQNAGYRKNEFPALPPDVRHTVAREWRRTFEAWQYSF